MFAIPVVLVATGTAGYQLIEGWNPFDALYMAVITLTTVGFMEIHPLSPAGRVFTMLLALGGVFTLFYVATELVGRRRERRGPQGPWEAAHGEKPVRAPEPHGRLRLRPHGPSRLPGVLQAGAAIRDHRAASGAAP
jgi:hypothetical protein